MQGREVQMSKDVASSQGGGEEWSAGLDALAGKDIVREGVGPLRLLLLT